MEIRVQRLVRPIAALGLACAAALAGAPAHALFSDDEARRAIIELRGRVELQNRDNDRRFEEVRAIAGLGVTASITRPATGAST